MNRRVRIEGTGRCGCAHYFEDDKKITFDWEIGGTVVAILWSCPVEEWNVKYPWAEGRNEEILKFVADEAIRQKSPGCIAELQSDGTTVHIKEN